MAFDPFNGAQGVARVDVFKLLGEQEENNTVHAHHYNEALVVLSKLGNVNGCLRILNSMLARDMKVHRTIMNSVITACAKAGDGQAAERWWRQMIQMGQSPNRVTYASVILAWVKAGDMCRAEEWVWAMKAAGFSSSKGFYRPIAHILLQANENDERDENNMQQQEASEAEVRCADRATKWLLQFHTLGVLLDRSTINLVMSVYARNAEAEKVERWVYHMVQAGIPANQSTFHALILAHVHAGHTEQAQTWIAQMWKMGFEPGAGVMEAFEKLQRGGASIGQLPTGNGGKGQAILPPEQGLALEAVRNSMNCPMNGDMDDQGGAPDLDDDFNGGAAPRRHGRGQAPWPEPPPVARDAENGNDMLQLAPGKGAPPRGGAMPGNGAPSNGRSLPSTLFDPSELLNGPATLNSAGYSNASNNGMLTDDDRQFRFPRPPQGSGPAVDPLLEAMVTQGLSMSAASAPARRTKPGKGWKGKDDGFSDGGKSGGQGTRGGGKGQKGNYQQQPQFHSGKGNGANAVLSGKGDSKGQKGGGKNGKGKRRELFEPRDVGSSGQQQQQPQQQQQLQHQQHQQQQQQQHHQQHQRDNYGPPHSHNGSGGYSLGGQMASPMPSQMSLQMSSPMAMAPSMASAPLRPGPVNNAHIGPGSQHSGHIGNGSHLGNGDLRYQQQPPSRGGQFQIPVQTELLMQRNV